MSLSGLWFGASRDIGGADNLPYLASCNPYNSHLNKNQTIRSGMKLQQTLVTCFPTSKMGTEMGFSP